MWQYITLYDYVWLYIAMYDYYDYDYDYAWLCITMYDYIWQYMTMYETQPRLAWTSAELSNIEILPEK